jgi:hypothetical protein
MHAVCALCAMDTTYDVTWSARGLMQMLCTACSVPA